MRVSICIPTYNQAAYVELAVRSAFQQSLKPCEIIVFDDCSTDDTIGILSKLSEEMPILKVKRHPVNLGIAKNVDSCLRAATGDFVIRLDSDDQLAPLYSEKLIELLLQFPDAGYAHAAVQEINQYGNNLDERRLIRETGYISAQGALKAAMKGYRVAANIIMFRRAALEAVNYLEGRPNFGEDYHLAASISAAGFGNVYFNEILSNYRVWIDANKVRQKRKLAEINGIRRVFEDVLEPAYKKSGWDLKELNYSKVRLACHHADCLSWDIYNEVEKQELENELYLLSSHSRVKLFVWIYLNGLGFLIALGMKVMFVPKSIVKWSILKLRPKMLKIN